MDGHLQQSNISFMQGVLGIECLGKRKSCLVCTYINRQSSILLALVYFWLLKAYVIWNTFVA